MIKERLREARKAARKTQKEVADHIGVTESAYCGYETGKRQPDALKIRKIAAFLQVTGDYLLETEDVTAQAQQDEMSSNLAVATLTDEESDLLAGFRSLNRAGKDFILSALNSTLCNPQMKEGPIQKREIS